MTRRSHTFNRRRLFRTTGVAGIMMAISSKFPGGTTVAMQPGISQDSANLTFVLVHGAWHGGWCWQKITPLLRAAGHDVFAPTLTGLGERVHLLSPEIDLDTHINDVLGVLEYEDLHNVVLVGHSYAGMVISAIAARAGDRLTRVVYLDAFFPEDGKALRDYAPAAILDETANTQGEGWRLPSYMFARDFGVTDPADVEWVDARLGDQPYATFTQPVDLGAGVPAHVERVYVLTTKDTFVPHADRARQDGCSYHELFDAGHDSMITMPEELVELLLAPVPA